MTFRQRPAAFFTRPYHFPSLWNARPWLRDSGSSRLVPRATDEAPTAGTGFASPGAATAASRLPPIRTQCCGQDAVRRPPRGQSRAARQGRPRSFSFSFLRLLLEAGPALVADLVVAAGEKVADVLVLVESHRLAVRFEHVGDHLGERPPVAHAIQDARNVLVHRPVPSGRGVSQPSHDGIREPEG